MGCLIKKQQIIYHVESISEHNHEKFTMKQDSISFDDRISQYINPKIEPNKKGTVISSITHKELPDSSVRPRKNSIYQESWFKINQKVEKKTVELDSKQRKLESQLHDKEFEKVELRASVLKYEQFIDIYVEKDKPCTVIFSGKWSTDVESAQTDQTGHFTKGLINDGQLLLRLPGCDYIPIKSSIVQFSPTVSGVLLASMFLSNPKDQPEGIIQAKFYNCTRRPFFNCFPELFKIPFSVETEEKPNTFLLFNLINFLRTDTERFISLFLRYKIGFFPSTEQIISKLTKKAGKSLIFSSSLTRLAEFCLARKVKDSSDNSANKFVESLPEEILDFRFNVFRLSFEVKGPFALLMECLKQDSFLELVFSSGFSYLGVSEMNIKLESSFVSIALSNCVKERLQVEEI